MRRTFSAVTALVLAGVLVGCDSATGNKDPQITLSLASSTATVGQGSASTVLVTIQRTNYTSAVTLTIEGLPQGVTATFAPPSLADGSPTSTLTINAAGSAAPGNFTLTVRASGAGVTEQTATIALMVNVTGNYTLSPLSTITVAQTGGGMATILIGRTGGNAGSVSLAVSGAPAGLTASFATSSTTDKAVSLSISATSTVATGPYTLTITGTSPGLGDQTTPLSVVVIAPPATATLTIPFCAVPLWFAYQNEGFHWQQATASGTSFSFPATQKVAVAFVFQDGLDTEANIYYATRTELASNTDTECRGPKTVTGTVSGLLTGQSARIAFGSADTTVSATQTAYTLKSVPDRALDLVATRGTSTSGTQGTFFTPDRMIIRRSLTQANNSSIAALDFLTEGFATELSTLTIGGLLSGEEIYFQNFLWTPTFTFGLIQTAAPGSASATVHSVPAVQRVAGDLHELYVEAYVATPTSVVGRAHIAYVDEIDNRTDNLGPVPSNSTISLLTATPYVRMRGQLVSQPEYPSFSRFSFLQGARTVLVGVSAAHLGATPVTWDATLPDFTGTAGFNASWMLGAGSTNTVFQADAYSGRVDYLFGATPANNDVLNVSFRAGFTSTALQLLASRAALLQPALTPMPRPRVQYFRR
jgi:hypothetical protein